MKTADLIGPALDWAVAKCEGLHRYDPEVEIYVFLKNHDNGFLHYSTDWAQGGPIIGREKISIDYWNHSYDGQHWRAACNANCKYSDVDGEFVEDSDTPRFASTPLIAAMRCYVVSKLGDEVEIPEELK